MIDEKELCKKAALHDALKGKGMGKGIYWTGQITPSEKLTKQFGFPASIIETDNGRWAEIQYEDRIEVYGLNNDGTIGKFDEVYRFNDYSLDWTTGTWISQEDYEWVTRYEDNEFKDEQDAKKWIADEFGFDVNKIQILNEIGLWMKRKSSGDVSMLIRVGTVDRKPYYSSTDCNYVRFNVICGGGWFYEVYNGMISLVED